MTGALPAAIIVVIGEGSLVAELANRLSGSYVRTLPKLLLRVALVILACILLAAPYLLAVANLAHPRWLCLLASCVPSVLITANFLFPYRFGIRRINRPPTAPRPQPLTPGIVLNRITIRTDLPADGPRSISCLILADLHCDTDSKLKALQDSFAQLRDKPYDMVFLLGDLGENDALLSGALQAVAGVNAKHGAFLVRGNHDFEGARGELIERLAREHSITLLSNTAYPIPQLQVELIGLEYPWRRTGLPPRSSALFAIGLAHTPDNIKLFSRLNVPLALAGHTHGGRLTLPLLGSALLPSRYGRFLDKGWFQFADTRMFITSGIGHAPGLFRRQGTIVDLTITAQAADRKADAVPLQCVADQGCER